MNQQLVEALASKQALDVGTSEADLAVMEALVVTLIKTLPPLRESLLEHLALTEAHHRSQLEQEEPLSHSAFSHRIEAIRGLLGALG